LTSSVIWHRLDIGLHLTGFDGQVHDDAEGQQEDDGQQTGKAKPQAGMPLGGAIPALDLMVDLLDALDFRRSRVFHAGQVEGSRKVAERSIASIHRASPRTRDAGASPP